MVGEYEIVILCGARTRAGSRRGCASTTTRSPQGAGEALAPYVRDQMKFFVAKVDIQKVSATRSGMVQLSPLRFPYEANELRLPVRLGLLNANGKQDLIVYVLHPSARFEVANYPNVFIPTNLDVVDAVRQSFAAFYAELFDETHGAACSGKAVVTEYAWQTSVVRSLPGAAAAAERSGDARRRTRCSSAAGAAAGAGAAARRRGGYYGNFASWVLTRLHTRYAKDDAVGGSDLPRGQAGHRRARQLRRHQRRRRRAGRSAAAATTSRAATSSATTGPAPVKCDHPRYGVWGGPPGRRRAARPSAAKGLATAPRGKVALKNVSALAGADAGAPGPAAAAPQVDGRGAPRRRHALAAMDVRRAVARAEGPACARCHADVAAQWQPSAHRLPRSTILIMRSR